MVSQRFTPSAVLVSALTSVNQHNLANSSFASASLIRNFAKRAVSNTSRAHPSSWASMKDDARSNGSNAENSLAHAARRLCTEGFLGSSTCSIENLHIMMLVGALSVSFYMVLCLWCFTKDYEDSHEGPLCPQLLAGQPGLGFSLKLDLSSSKALDVVACDSNRILCRLVVNWADTKVATGPAGIILTLSLQSPSGVPLAAVAVRSDRNFEDAVILCRPGCLVFGSIDVPADPKAETTVFYRTGSRMLGVKEDPRDPSQLKVISYLDAEVGTAHWEQDTLVGNVVAELDAGLFLCSVLGRHFRRLVLDKQLLCPSHELVRGSSAESLSPDRCQCKRGCCCVCAAREAPVSETCEVSIN